jgi:hypothetical protein
MLAVYGFWFHKTAAAEAIFAAPRSNISADVLQLVALQFPR